MMNKDQILCEKYNYNSIDELKKSQQLFMIEKTKNSNSEENKISNRNYISKNRFIVKCECGKSITKYKLNLHKKTKYHIDFINNKQYSVTKFFK